MKSKHINIAPYIEQPERELVLSHNPQDTTPKDADGIDIKGEWRETGSKETINYDGTWEGLKAYIETLLAGYNDAATEFSGTSYTCTITRHEAGRATAQLQLTPMQFIKSSDSDGEGGEGGGGGEGGEGSGTSGNPGDSRSYPEISISIENVEEPLLTNPICANLSEEQMCAVNMFCSGATMGEIVYGTSGNPVGTVGNLISGLPGDVKSLVLAGVTSYYSPKATVTIKYKSSKAALAVGSDGATISDSVPGVTNLSKNRNFLFMGSGVEQASDGSVTVSETYLQSGPGGWNTTLYKQQS